MRRWEVLVVTVICLVAVAQGKLQERDGIAQEGMRKEGSVDKLAAANEIEISNEGAILGASSPEYYTQLRESFRHEARDGESTQSAERFELPGAINLQTLLTRNFEVRLGFVLSLLAFLFLIIL